MKTSVAIATYNGEAYITEQLESILCQTQSVSEVVICDDGSNDETVKLISEFIDNHCLGATWKLIANKKNLGYAKNFRKAAYLCTGDIIFFSDQDDIWAKDRVEVMTSVMQEDPKISLLTTQMMWFSSDEEKNRLPAGIMSKTRRIKAIPFNCKNGYLRSCGCLMCVRGTFLRSIESEWFSGWAHDEACWCLAVIRGEIFEMTDYVSLFRRDHPKRTSGHLGHQKEQRIRYLSDLIVSSQHMLQIADRGIHRKKVIRFYSQCLLTARARENFLHKRTLHGALTLLTHLKYYYSKKSFFVELFMK